MTGDGYFWVMPVLEAGQPQHSFDLIDQGGILPSDLVLVSHLSVAKQGL